MNNKRFEFDFSDLQLTADQIERVMGYDEGESDPHFRDLIENALKEASKKCCVRAEYRIFSEVSLSDSDKSISIYDTHFDIGKIIFGQLEKAGAAALFLCTAGEGISKLSRTAMESEDILGAYIYDIVGSEIAEAAADLMQDALENELALSGLQMTNRFSPGYCGWDVAEQKKLFGLLPGTWCGIRLTPSSLMNPEKSVSGIIGIGESVKHLPYTCSLCDMKDCIYRKHRINQ
jgi:hypothetical protein